MVCGSDATDLQAHFVDGLRSRRAPKDSARVIADEVAACGLLDTLRDEPDALDLAHWVGMSLATALVGSEDDPEAGLLLAFDRLCSGRTAGGWVPPDQALGGFVQGVSRAFGVTDYGPAVARLHGANPEGFSCRLAVEFLSAHKLVSPDAVIDRELVRGRASRRGSYNPDTMLADITKPEFWLHGDRERAVTALRGLLESEPDDGLAVLAAGVEDSLHIWFDCEEILERLALADHDTAMRRWEFFSGSEWYVFAPLLEPIIRYLAARSDARPGDAGLRAVWLRLMHRAFGHDPDAAPADLVKSALRVADKSWGKARSIFAGQDAEALRANQGVLREASTALMLFASLEKSLEPMVFALRAARTPCVSPSLEYQHETFEEDCPPEPWRCLPDLMALRMHYGLRAEQPTDPELAAARGKFCGFLLGRLKTRKGEKRSTHGELASRESLLERDTVWRTGYIRAASALYSNPKGKGHLLLDWSRRHDPDEKVRDEAHAAYIRMRHAETPPEGTSIRRCFFEAFRWLRWAHMISLGQEVSEEGVQRTLRKEIRETERPRNDG